MATLSDLAKRMTALRAGLATAGLDTKKAVAIAVLDSVLENSPVDTSLFVSNWQAGSSVAALRDAFALGKGGSTREASVAAARAAGVAAINASRPGEPVVISNPVPYGQYLNDGTSGRAPLLFVERAVLVGNLLLASLAKTIGSGLG